MTKLIEWLCNRHGLVPVPAHELANIERARIAAVDLGRYTAASGALNNHAHSNPKAVRRIDRLVTVIAENLGLDVTADA